MRSQWVAAGWVLAVTVSVLVQVGCRDRSKKSTTITGGAEFAVVSGLQPIQASHAPVDPSLDLARLGVSGPQVVEVYELTTPADTPFRFSVLARPGANEGVTKIALGHVRNGDVTPDTAVTSLDGAGIVASGNGGSVQDPEWLEVRGDGFSQLTIRGEIQDDQVLVVRTEARGVTKYVLIDLRIGDFSEINVLTSTAQFSPHVVSEQTLYSSNSRSFALPTIAISGDRATIVTYEGDGSDPYSLNRYELRLQYDWGSGTVTGGAQGEASVDHGNWRDHEIAALYNVLAVVHCGANDVTARLSFDRGATFSQEESLEDDPSCTRLVQIGIASDYSLAIVFWRSAVAGGGWNGGELVLVEAAPATFDSSGSPTSYAFTTPQVIFAIDEPMVPLIMDVEYSEAGDLVIGYGFTRFLAGTCQFRCATRLYSEEFSDVHVADVPVIPCDPSVSLIGSGQSLEIFYAMESSLGLDLVHSTDAGQTFGSPLVLGQLGAYAPSVFARELAGNLRLDVLYLQPTGNGTELRVDHWDDFAGQAGECYLLTEATRFPSSLFAGDSPGTPGYPAPQGGVRITEIPWFGYDAVFDNDQIIVAVDEETYDSYGCLAFGMFFAPPWTGGTASGVAAAPAFTPSDPPPLAPGLTEPVDSPNTAHMHQLKVIVLE